MSALHSSCGSEEKEADIGIFIARIWKRVDEGLSVRLRPSVPSAVSQMIVESPSDKTSGHGSNFILTQRWLDITHMLSC
jgi:hypothetical protein